MLDFFHCSFTGDISSFDINTLPLMDLCCYLPLSRSPQPGSAYVRIMSADLCLLQEKNVIQTINEYIREQRRIQDYLTARPASSITPKRVLGMLVHGVTLCKSEMDTRAVICNNGRGRYFISRHHENNHGNAFEQTLLTHLNVNTH